MKTWPKTCNLYWCIKEGKTVAEEKQSSTKNLLKTNNGKIMT